MWGSHTMLQKSGAKVQLLFELSKSWLFKININLDFSVQFHSFGIHFSYSIQLCFCIFICFCIHIAYNFQHLFPVNEINSFVQAVHEFFKVFSI